MDDFNLAVQKINPDKTILCYNGDITDANSFKALTDRFPDIDEIMIGRGLFANPALIAELKGISMDKAELRERLKNWHDEILSGYLSIFSGVFATPSMIPSTYPLIAVIGVFRSWEILLISSLFSRSNATFSSAFAFSLSLISSKS